MSPPGGLAAAATQHPLAVPTGRSRQEDSDYLSPIPPAAIEDYIAKTVATAPPLTAAQRDRLAVLLRDGGGPDV